MSCSRSCIARVNDGWATPQRLAARVKLFSPQDVTLNAVASDESYKPDGKTYEITLKTPYAGLHKVDFVDGGDFTRIEWPAGWPVTIESGIGQSMM